MPIRYKLYTIEEGGKEYREWYTKKQLQKYQLPEGGLSLFECAERMVFKFNRSIRDSEKERFAYKLEKVSVSVVGSEAYYGLNVSQEMCDPEF